MSIGSGFCIGCNGWRVSVLLSRANVAYEDITYRIIGAAM